VDRRLSTILNIKLNPLRQRQPRGVVDRIRLPSHVVLLGILSEFFGAYDRILKVARTIADIADSEDIRVEHPPKPSNTATSTEKAGQGYERIIFYC
jgi:hypothetical protein